jgi:hypothetical protein
MNRSQELSPPTLPNAHSGQWVAWDADRKQLLAVADTYAEIMRRVADAGAVDPVVEKAPGFHPEVAARPFTLLEDESTVILDDVRKTIPDPEQWLDTPNTRLWCQKPRDLIGTPQERYVRYLLRGIRSGITS